MVRKNNSDSTRNEAHQHRLQQARDLIDAVGVDATTSSGKKVVLPAFAECAVCGNFRNPHESKMIYLKLTSKADGYQEIVTLCPPAEDDTRERPVSMCERRFKTPARNKAYTMRKVSYQAWCKENAE